MKNQHENRKRGVSFLALSIFLHVLLLLFFTYQSYKQKRDQELAQKDQPSVQFIDIADAEKELKHSLVEQDEKEKADKEKPKDAKFMSRVNKDVKKETKSVNRGDFKNENSKAQQAVPPPQPKSESQAKAESSQEQKQKAPEMKTFAGGDLPINAKKSDAPKKAKSFKDLQTNSMQQMQQQAFAQVSQTNDYLKDVEIGAETHLKTREFLYYNYFNRIKQKLRQAWQPMVHDRVREMVRQGRSLASDSTSTTSLVITLDAEGHLVRVQVATSSGLQDLDSVAMEALKVAAPFPNPPKDLITDGLVLINWNFILES